MGDEELSELKKVYDELWRDAKTLIKDMNSNITTALDFFYLAATAFGSIISAIAGVMTLRWYYKLKNRYAKLIQLEKTIED